mmetsp:Transcript_9024/g.23570  ORF Transcript_9024/g.23570 Transcript_9024/m.23570 type:complete len:214 (-) Transcript_9024:374-1015(-)
MVAIGRAHREAGPGHRGMRLFRAGQYRHGSASEQLRCTSARLAAPARCGIGEVVEVSARCAGGRPTNRHARGSAWAHCDFPGDAHDARHDPALLHNWFGALVITCRKRRQHCHAGAPAPLARRRVRCRRRRYKLGCRFEVGRFAKQQLWNERQWPKRQRLQGHGHNWRTRVRCCVVQQRQRFREHRLSCKQIWAERCRRRGFHRRTRVCRCVG